MNTFILAQKGNFKTFLEENDAISFHNFYMFTKKNIEHSLEYDVHSG